MYVYKIHKPVIIELQKEKQRCIYIDIYKLFKEKNETFHFANYFGIAFINYIFIQQNKIHNVNYFLKFFLQF